MPFTLPRDRAIPDHLMMTGLGDNVFVIWDDGHLLRYDLRDRDDPRVVEAIDLVEEAGETLTAATFLIGRNSLITGDSLGRTRIWFRIRQADAERAAARGVTEAPEALDEDKLAEIASAADTIEGDGLRLINTHQLPAGEHPVTALAESWRSRMVSVGYADGTIRLVHTTSNPNEVVRGNIAQAVRSLTMAPRDNGIVAFGADGSVSHLTIDTRHPAVTLRSVFRPVWYEGYPEPRHMWQSSAATDDFEPKYGLTPLIFGTLKATFYSMLFGLPLALLAAIYTSEFLHRKVRARIKPVIEMMASLPSVVLGFVAALVIAPIIEHVVPATLMAFVTIPLAVLLGAYLWQLMPYGWSVRLTPYRIAFILIAVLLAIPAALLLGPFAERVLFAGDVRRWLDGQIGTGIAAWLVLLLPLSGVAVAFGFARWVTPVLRERCADWSRTRWALLDLGKFFAGLVLTLLIAFAAGALFTFAPGIGWDPRGSYISTYEQRNALIVGFVMGFAIIPIIYTIAEDALSAVPDTLRSASLGAGATPWQTAARLVVPTAMSGLFSASMIGLGRAAGETMLMIVLLLGWIFYQGSQTFVPQPVVRITTADGQTLLGELTRSEWYQPRVEAEPVEPETSMEPEGPGAPGTELEAEVDDAPQPPAPAAGDTLAADEDEEGVLGLAHRQLVRIGNREITGTPFQWVSDSAIEDMTEPEWAVTVERLRWGPFYGEPVAFEIDGETVASSPAEAWAQFEAHHGEVLNRRAQRRNLERYDMGRVRDMEESARLNMRSAELRHGADSPEHRRAREHFDRTREQAAELFAEVRQRIDALNAENNRYRIVMDTAQGQRAVLPLDEIVRAYPANRLSFWDKAVVYVDRWREFLLDEPREANTEGGVFPPLIGTVVMTLLMCFAVVPFGVLAALYLREYAKAGPVVSCVRIAVNNLAGVPSIVFGVFGLGFFCYIVGGYIDEGPDNPASMGPWLLALMVLFAVTALAGLLTFLKLRAVDERQWPMRALGYVGVGLWIVAVGVTLWLVIHVPFFDGFFAARAADGSPTFGKGGVLWASLTLALLTLPVVIVATEEALAAVPSSMREGSFACGASKWQTIRRIVLPRAMPGIMTGMILAMARGAGEVAPLMLVGAVTLAPELPVDGSFPYVHVDRSFMHLGFHIYDVGFQSPDSEGAKPMVYTATLLLVAMIAVLNLSAFWLRSHLRRKYQEHQF